MNGHDPSNYRAMTQPHETLESLEKAMEAFLDDVTAARKKHRIADVSFVVAGIAMVGDEESQRVVPLHLGLEANQPVLLAFALGQSRNKLNARLDKLMAGKVA